MELMGVAVGVRRGEVPFEQRPGDKEEQVLKRWGPPCQGGPAPSRSLSGTFPLCSALSSPQPCSWGGDQWACATLQRALARCHKPLRG